MTTEMENPIVEETHLVYEGENPENSAQHTIEENYPYNEEEFPHMQECYKHVQVASDTTYVYNPGEHQLYEQPSAVDLRTTKSLEESPRKDANFDTTKKQVISETQLVENLFFNYPCPNNSSAKLFVIDNDTSLKANCAILNHNVQLEYCDSNTVTDISLHKNDSEIDYKTTEFGSQNLWNSSTNTDPVVLVDQESQTLEMERKDASVQTESTVLPYSMYRYLKEPDVKYTCSICQRTYSTKNNFHRHLRTHIKNEGCEILTNMQFTTEAKHQVYKKPSKKYLALEHRPVLAQEPQYTDYECNTCKMYFLTKTEMNDHKCVYKPLPMTKCSECDVKFYTTGGLNDHFNFVHRKENREDKLYNCIFCNQSFTASYSFHLHLDTHLSL